MSERSTEFDESSSGAEFDESTITIVAGLSAVMNLVAFTAVGAFVLESVVYGALAGVFGAVGTYLFLPWLLGVQLVQQESDGEVAFTEAVDRATGSVPLAGFGVGLEVGSILMLVVALGLEETPLVAAGSVALVIALIGYLAASVLLDG